MSIFYCFNIFTKLAVGALSGFEYVAILAGETRAPARDIGRSVLIASPVIALMFILGTSSVLAFVGNNPIDLIGPVPQTLRLGLAVLSNRKRDRVDRNSVDDRSRRLLPPAFT
jgi:amino acid transporter